ncbi:hypothetical protein [Streptomyces sp. NPDC024089]|uniref:hypothetical protein n=1 Tax=Streptomyces sp. NPDC024089 TaxID=3154328 RepID=UPI0033D67113
MTIRRQDCYVVTCDICHAEYTDPETEQTVWWTDAAAAEQGVRRDRWMVLAPDLPTRIICPEDDDAHRAIVDTLMPPEPVMQIPGQIDLNGIEESSR